MLYYDYYIIMGRDRLTMGYFDNLDNEFLNKYEKKIIYVFFYLYIDFCLNFI
jgi:hypothetical protein